MEDTKVVELESQVKALEEILANIKFSEAKEVTITGGHFGQIHAGNEGSLTFNQSNCSVFAQDNSSFDFHQSNVGVASTSEADFVNLELQLDDLEDQFSGSSDEEAEEKLAQIEEARDMIEESRNLIEEGEDLLHSAKGLLDDLDSFES